MTDAPNKTEWLERHECLLLMEETSAEELRELDSDLPSDTHLVLAEKEGEFYADAVRAYKMADIFDAYYDQGYQVKLIQYGYGRIKPKLYTSQPKEEKK